ncbi:MAG: YciI family protein, partial [Stellaceae bacterium]
MRYMFLVYSRERGFAEASPQDRERVKPGHWAVMDESREKGVFIAGEPLQPTATATTVRKEDGGPLVLDSPFAETKEQLAGYYIL